MLTAKDHLKAAWQALLRNDLAGRDRQCDLAKQAIERDEANEARIRTLTPTDPLNLQ